MKRYRMQLGLDPRAQMAEYPTGPYCLVEEVRPLLEEAVKLLRHSATCLADEGYSLTADADANLTHRITAFLA